MEQTHSVRETGFAVVLLSCLLEVAPLYSTLAGVLRL